MDGEAVCDEMWRCPHGHVELGAGMGKREGGNYAVVQFTAPPKCWCGSEMEQATSMHTSEAWLEQFEDADDE